MLKKSTFYCLVLITAFLSNCAILPESGPVNIVKDHNNDEIPVNYDVYDVTTSNLSSYNSTQFHRSDKLPKADSSRTFTDTIQKGDTISLYLIDPSPENPFAGGQVIGPLEVSQKGTANIPFIGTMELEGITIHDAEFKIKEKFALKFSSAEVSVSRAKNIQLRANAIGLVARPGQHTINRPDFTLADLVSLSGGTSIDAHLCEYKLHRDKKTYVLDSKQIAKNKTRIQDGDLLEVVKSKYQHLVILGNVNRPGNHAFPSSHSHLTDFIGAGNGINLNNGDPSGIFVFRKKPGAKNSVYRFNVRKADGLIAASKFHLHGDDIIYVTEAPLSRWNRILSNILPFQQVQGLRNLTL